MRDLGPYLYLLLFAAFALLNYLMQKLSRRQKEQQSAGEEEGRREPEGAKRAGELRQRRAASERDGLRAERDRLGAERDRLGAERDKLRAERLGQRSAAAPPGRREQTQKRSRVPQQITDPVTRVRSSAERISRVRSIALEPEEVLKARAHSARVVTVAPSRAQSARRRELQALLADRGSLRQAIILKTLLGPCRAQQPTELR